MQSSTETLGKIEEDEKPLMTSSPAISGFRNQPEMLNRNPEYETTEDEVTDVEEDQDKFLELQTKQRQNLLLSRPYFLQPNLSPISSKSMETSETLKAGQSQTLTSIETDFCTTTSRTLLAGHNDTFDEDMSDISYDH